MQKHHKTIQIDHANKLDVDLLANVRPHELAMVAAQLSAGTKGKRPPRECLHDALDLVASAASFLQTTAKSLQGTCAVPEYMVPVSEAARAAGISERTLMGYVRKLAPSGCDPGEWVESTTRNGLMNRDHAFEIRAAARAAKKARARAGYRGQKKAVDRALAKYARS